MSLSDNGLQNLKYMGFFNYTAVAGDVGTGGASRNFPALSSGLALTQTPILMPTVTTATGAGAGGAVFVAVSNTQFHITTTANTDLSVYKVHVFQE